MIQKKIMQLVVKLVQTKSTKIVIWADNQSLAGGAVPVIEEGNILISIYKSSEESSMP